MSDWKTYDSLLPKKLKINAYHHQKTNSFVFFKKSIVEKKFSEAFFEMYILLSTVCSNLLWLKQMFGNIGNSKLDKNS